MMAAVLVLDPIFEADLQPEQYAYRRDRSQRRSLDNVNERLGAFAAVGRNLEPLQPPLF
jgi:hypothetical protein